MTVLNWGLWLIPLSLYICWIIYKENDRAISLLFATVLLNAVGVLFLMDYSDHTFLDKMAFKQMASVGLACFIVLFLFAFSINTLKVNYFLNGIGWWCFLSSFYVIFNAFIGIDSFNRGGVLGNASMLACGLAVSYPILYSRLKSMLFTGSLFWMALVIPLIAIVLLGSSMGYGVLATVLTILFLHRARNAIFAIVCIYGGAALTGYFFIGKDFFSSSGRLALWGHALNWQWTEGNMFVGQGIGSAPIWLPHIQNLNNFDRGSWFVQMHNDWLQILFEFGVVGLLVTGCIYMMLLYRSIPNRFTCASLMGYGVFMMGNFPLHWPMYAVLGVIIGMAAYLEVEDEVDSTYPA